MRRKDPPSLVPKSLGFKASWIQRASGITAYPRSSLEEEEEWEEEGGGGKGGGRRRGREERRTISGKWRHPKA